MTEFLIYQGKAAVVLAAFYMFYSKLAGVNEETVILVDGKWENFEGYQRTLKFQSDKIKEIEYCLNKDKISMISVIFDREYDDEYTIRN